MKQILMILLCVCLFSGCTDPKTFETMSDLYYAPATPPPGEISVWLPEGSALSTMENDEGGKLYLCDGYTVSVQTAVSGDLDATLCSATGYGKEKLNGISWKQGDLSRYECAWAAAGESGDQVGRTVVLDDGSYHYVVTILGEADLAGAMTDTWAAITASVALDADPVLPDTADGTGQ